MQIFPNVPSSDEVSEIQIPLVDEYAYTNRKLRVVAIGSGFFGLTLTPKTRN
jgi:hypothetical protein